MRRRELSYRVPKRRRWDAISWWYSLILLIPLLGFAITIAYQQWGFSRGYSGRVIDAYTREAVAKATILAGDKTTETDGRGRFKVDKDTVEIRVVKDGYDEAHVTLDPESSGIEVALRPNVVRGVIRAAADDSPLAGVTVEAHLDGTAVVTTTSEADGSFELREVPEGATLVVSGADYATVEEQIGQELEFVIALRPDVVTGTVVDLTGSPIAGARVAIGEAEAVTEADGSYRLKGAPASGQVVFKAPGYRAATVPLDETMQASAQLEPFDAKAIYLTADTVANPERFQELIDLVERTELNAMVIDLKDSSGLVFYDTKVQLAHDIGAVRPMFDPKAVLETLHERGIYVIARIVVFEDPILAEQRSEWAIKRADGSLWRTWNGLAWVNAHRSEVWDYDTALALEAAELGFDEIQLDYIRFPSDGVLAEAEYGVEHNTETRMAAIRDFLTQVNAALAPTPAYLGVDVFGLAFWELSDGGIGQNLETIVPLVDYICPMIYPSHFYAGSMGFDVPNDHPYEVILWSLQNGAERVPDEARKFRPWLQDFSYGQGIRYGDDEVRAQIKASDDFGSSGWMLWNAANVYHEGALRPSQ